MAERRHARFEFGAVDPVENQSWLPRRRSDHKMEPFLKGFKKQRLDDFGKSRLRVICATPGRKRARGGRLKTFLYCLCRVLSYPDFATEGGIPKSSRVFKLRRLSPSRSAGVSKDAMRLQVRVSGGLRDQSRVRRTQQIRNLP